jgi:translation initiation factor eIF-2B subunit alpha/methylthioribose-1-phosphate isomerase
MSIIKQDLEGCFSMKVKSGDKILNYSAVWYEDNRIKFIDQRRLPERFEIYEAGNLDEVAHAISDMIVRGAPAIGVAAAYGLAMAIDQRQAKPEDAYERLHSTRPTAYDLDFALNYIMARKDDDVISAAGQYTQEIIERCRKIGVNGEKLIEDKMNILTHCNAGALATVEYGTALAPMRAAANNNKNIFVYVDETRPRLQGAKLTAWELYNEDIPCAVIADNAAGFYMKNGSVDLVITGADRISASGDAANKIGTYEKAVLARENGIPFYIAAPVSTFDRSILSGDDIIIENRSEDEVRTINDKLITPKGVSAKNPAFDVTPAKYIAGFITEIGIIKPEDLSGIEFSI